MQVTDPAEKTHSRDRIMHAGKSLFARFGYEQTSTAAIARITEQIPPATPAHDAILGILRITIDAFGRDHDMAVLFLFEGRRIRGTEVTLSRGFLQFYQIVQSVIRAGQSDGSFRNDL